MRMSVRFTRKPLSFAAAVRELEGPGLGGIVVFAGRVRPDRTRRGRVRALLYEAHLPLGREVFLELERAARKRFGVGRVVLWHRLGSIPVDEASVLVGAAAGHRAEAFAAARFLIERLKEKAPIWKTDQSRLVRRPRRPPRGSAGRSAG
jgi:molybdopterin synthase catalytic subunit